MWLSLTHCFIKVFYDDLAKFPLPPWKRPFSGSQITSTLILSHFRNFCHLAPAASVAHSTAISVALELVDSARQHGVRFGYVAVDGGYGKDPAFLRGLETRSLCFLADVHKHQRIWLDDPAPYRPATTSRGRPASIRRTDRPALTVAEWAAQQPVSAWKRIKLRQGEKGTLKAEYLHARVWAWDRKEETARHWHLLVRRECGADTPSHFVFSNADASTSISRLARMHGCRRLALQAEAPMLSLADLVMAINQLLPRPEPTPNRIASIIHERHRRRQDALAACLRRESEI